MIGFIFNLLSYSLSSVFLGVFITLLGTALLFYAVRSWKRDSTFTPLSIVAGVVLFFCLAAQNVMMCGAITMKNMGDDIESTINQIVSVLPIDMEMSQEETSQVFQILAERLPLVGEFYEDLDFSGHTPAELAHAVNEVFQEELSWYIFRRVLWELGFIIVGITLVVLAMESSGRGSRRRGGGSAPRRRNYDI